MKAIFVSFNQAYYEMILNVMDRNNIRGFKTGEPHYGSHAWPTLNSAILAMVDDEKVDHFLEILHQMDQKTEAQGLRAFVWNIEKTI